MTEPSRPDRKARVSVRFVVEPFEILIEAEDEESQVGSALLSVVRSIGGMQKEISSAVSDIDITKFRPIEPKPAVEPKGPLEKVAAQLQVSLDPLKKIFLVEDSRVYTMCKREDFGPKGPGEKAALAMLYVYKFGLDKKPTYEEVNSAYEKIGFDPASFGAQVKQNLLNQKKIAEEGSGKGLVIWIEPRAIPEAQSVIRKLLQKV